MSRRIALAGAVDVEVDDRRVEGRGLGGLGRLALAYLVLERHRPVTREELAEVLWGDDRPASWETALRVVVSRLRALLRDAGLSFPEVLTTASGCYRLQLPEDVEVDVEAAGRAVTDAEAALRAGRPEAARQAAAEAAAVAGRPFLAGTSGDWVERRQGDLRQLRVRALEAASEASAALRSWAEAVAAAEEAIALEPFRESAHVLLMAGHAGAGNRGEALRAYERCRRLLAEELGVDPSPPTQQAYARLLAEEPDLAPAPPPPQLPLALTSFVGRASEMAEVRRLLAATRLLTLIGTGGVGKTRLALHVASEVAGEGAEGAALVELGPVSDPGVVAHQVRSALAVGEEPGRSPLDTVVAHLRHRRALLVLDNCEHLLPACAALAQTLLGACPELRILATSREPLRVPGEVTWRVPSLSTPPPEPTPPLEQLAGYEAVRLFLERARSTRPDLVVSEEDGPALAQLCHRLDGIPLALELAAARASALSIAELAERVGDRFRVLTAGARTAPARHQTLRAAVDWTYDALSPPEATLFNRLSVFAGGFTLGAAEETCAGDGLERDDVVGLLSSLVDKSLVVAEPAGAVTRYRLLETMRRYGLERLGEAGEAGAGRDRHLAWATSLAERADAALRGPDQDRWLQALDAALDDLRAALEWGSASPDAAPALLLAATLERFWEVRGYVSEGRSWLESLLARAAGPPPGVRAKALNSAAILAQRQGDYDRARALHTENLAVARQVGHELGVSAALHGLGNLAALQGDLGAARSLYQEALAIGRRLGDVQVVAATLTNLGTVAQNQAEFDAARSLFEESLALRRELGDRHGIAIVVGNLAYLAFQQGDHPAARSLYQESLALQQELGDPAGIANSLCNLGYLALAEGDHDRAQALLEESLAMASALGDKYWMVLSLLRLAKVARAQDDHERAAAHDRRVMSLARELGAKRAMAEWLEGVARTAVACGALDQAATLLGAAGAARDHIGAPLPPAERMGHDHDVGGCRDGLGEEAFRAAWDKGRAMSLAEAVHHASYLSWMVGPSTAPAPVRSGDGGG